MYLRWILTVAMVFIAFSAKAESESDFIKVSEVEIEILKMRKEVLQDQITHLKIGQSSYYFDSTTSQKLQIILREHGMSLPQYMRIRSRNFESYNEWLSQKEIGFDIEKLRADCEALSQQINAMN